jgi:transposase
MTETTTLSVGIDCGSEVHQVCVLNHAGAIVGERRVGHNGQDLLALAAWLLTLGEPDPTGITIAIEVPHGTIVEMLLERGFPVYALNPKQLDRFRERYTVAGAKDDRRDAWVLASAVQSDRAAFRAVRIDDPAIIELRGLSRLDSELGEELRRATNQLRDQLHRYFPALLTLCPAADERWLWQLLAIAPTPVEAGACRPPVLDRLLKHARIRRFTVAELQAVLATTPVVVAPGTVEAARYHVRVLLPRLHLLDTQRTESATRLAHLLEQMAREPPGENREHHDVTILLSVPGVGVRIGAMMLAEAAASLRARDYHAIRLLAGVAPVTKASGKSRVVVMRYACNTRLKTACYHWARVAMQTDGAAHRHYTVLRAAGHSHARALRGVGDRLLAVGIGMLRTGTLYDPQRPRRIGGRDARAYPPPSRPSPSAGPAQAASPHA